MDTKTNSIEEIVKEFEDVFEDAIGEELGHGYNHGLHKCQSFLRTALTSAIQGERERIIKLLPPEDKPKLGSENQDIYVAYANGYNDYRHEAIKIVNQE